MCVQHPWRHRYRCRPLGVASALFLLSANQIYLMLVVWNGTKDVDLGSKQIEQHRRVGLGLVHPTLHPMRSRRTYFGFLAPVLGKQSPAVLDSINQYLPVVIVNGLAALLFMIGYALFGVAMIRTATPPRWAGVLVAVGASDPLAGFRDSSAGLDRRVADRDLGQCESWRRPRLARRSAVAHRPLRMCLWQISQHEHEHRDLRRIPPRNSHPRPHHVRAIIFRAVAALAALFFVVAVVLMASAPGVLLQSDQQTRTELNRWLLTAAWHRRSGQRDADPSPGSRTGGWWSAVA
jgi:hypothetical protein